MAKKSGEIDYNVPLRLPMPGEDTEAMFRRLIEFSYAVGRQYRADGGRSEIEDAIRTAQNVGDQRAMSHMDGGPGVIEKQDVKLREPLSGYEMTVGRFPKQTAPAIEGALQTASEIAPYFTPAAPIAAARDIAVGLREGDMSDLAMSAFGVPGKLGRAAKAAAVGAYALEPEEAEAGVIGNALKGIRAYHGPSPDMAQKITSADTSIKQIPALFRSKHFEVVAPDHRNVDIGGGRFDLGTDFLRQRGIESHVLDPFNRPQEHNEEILRMFSQDPAHSATVANVLNVIAEPDARRSVIQQAYDLVRPGGKAYFGIYEGDKSGFGRATSKGWQENRPAASYEEEIGEMFPGLQRRGNIFIAPRRSDGGEVEREDFDKGGGVVSLAKALLSLHNMKSHRLGMAEKLGGLPVPSIAIKDPEHGFKGFGDITLVGGEEFATPSKTNPVFASDVYSPRFPSLDDSEEKIFRGFTPSGNRRYAPLTMENAVREMKGNIRGGEGYNYGAGNIRASVTPQFKNIKEVQAARDKIISEEEFAPHKEEANRMLFELADKFHPYSKYSNSGFGHAQTFSETLADIGRGRRSAWAQDYEPLPPELKAEAMGYLSYLKNMPTEYFEAKPQRAVSLGEFSGAIVPENIIKEVSPRLKNLGVREIVPFNPDLTGSQQKALREFSGMHFNEGGSVIDDALDVISALPQAAE